MINKAENYPKNRNPRGKSACRTAKKAAKSENLRLQFTKKKNREIYPRRSAKRPKKAKFQGKSASRTSAKYPKKQKSKATIHQKKKTGKSAQRRSVKRPKKAKIKDKITQKSKISRQKWLVKG